MNNTTSDTRLPEARGNKRLAFTIATLMVSCVTGTYFSYGIDAAHSAILLIGGATTLLVAPFSWLVRALIYISMILMYESDVTEETNAVISVTILLGEFASLFIRRWRDFATMMGIHVPPKRQLSALYFFMLFRDIGFAILFAIGDIVADIFCGSRHSSRRQSNQRLSESDNYDSRFIGNQADPIAGGRNGNGWVSHH